MELYHRKLIIEQKSKNLNFQPPDLKHVRYQGSARTNNSVGSVYKVSMCSIMYMRMLRMSYCFMEAKISLGRPMWQWNLYFFIANAVCCALSPFLWENISFCGCSNDVKRCAPIQVHVPPDFPEETTHDDCVTCVQTLQDKTFCCAEFAIRYVAIACRFCTVNKETTWMRKETHNILHNPKQAWLGSTYNEILAKRGKCAPLLPDHAAAEASH